MNGLTTVQQWRHDHITRCTCGSWLMLADRQLHGHAPITCPHLNPDAMEKAA